MGRMAYQRMAPGVDTSLVSTPAPSEWGAKPRRGFNEKMDIIGYWKNAVAPYIRARFGRSERGAALVEYALLVALIAVVCIVAITLLGKNASSKFQNIANSLNS